MATTTITNTASISGTLDDTTVELTSNETDVIVVTGLTATKTADADYFVNGTLTYTIVIANEDGNPSFEDGTFTDQIDDTFTLSSDSDAVLVDGVAAAYTFTDNLLTIDSLPTIEGGDSVTVKIKVVLA